MTEKKTTGKKAKDSLEGGGFWGWIDDGAGRVVIIVVAVLLVGAAVWLIVREATKTTTPEQDRILEHGQRADYVCMACKATGEMRVPFDVQWDTYVCEACDATGPVDLMVTPVPWGKKFACPECKKAEAVRKGVKCPNESCGKEAAVKGIKCGKCRATIVENYQRLLVCPKCGYRLVRDGPMRDPSPPPIRRR